MGAHRGIAAQPVFVVDYAVARAGWQEGEAVTFPIGTYWLRRFANVPIAAG